MVCGVFLSAVLALFGAPALRAICASAPAAVPAASRYLSVRLLGLPAFLAAMVLQVRSKRGSRRGTAAAVPL